MLETRPAFLCPGAGRTVETARKGIRERRAKEGRAGLPGVRQDGAAFPVARRKCGFRSERGRRGDVGPVLPPRRGVLRMFFGRAIESKRTFDASTPKSGVEGFPPCAGAKGADAQARPAGSGTRKAGFRLSEPDVHPHGCPKSQPPRRRRATVTLSPSANVCPRLAATPLTKISSEAFFAVSKDVPCFIS